MQGTAVHDPARRGLVGQRAAATLAGVSRGWYDRNELIEALHRGARIRRAWCEQFLAWCESHDVVTRRDAGSATTYVDPERLAREWPDFEAAYHAPAEIDLRPLDADALAAVTRHGA
jgi:hypothetical protein